MSRIIRVGAPAQPDSIPSPTPSVPASPTNTPAAETATDARRATSGSKQQANNNPTSIRPSRAVVVAVPRSKAKYCLPSRKYCSGCIRRRYCPTATLASGSEVARYQVLDDPNPSTVPGSPLPPRRSDSGSQTETQRTRTQGILPQQSLITVGRLDVDIAFEPHHIVHRAAGVARHFL